MGQPGGGPRLNRRSEGEAIERRRIKMGASQRWFTRRRGGGKGRKVEKGKWLDKCSNHNPCPRIDHIPTCSCHDSNPTPGHPRQVADPWVMQCVGTLDVARRPTGHPLPPLLETRIMLPNPKLRRLWFQHS